MTSKKQARKQPAPRALKDEALDQATGGAATFKEFTITKKTDVSG